MITEKIAITMMKFKALTKRIVNLLGLEIIRAHDSPRLTLLGLTQFNFGCIIDIGANEGQFARSVLKFFPHARLYCFEPLPEPFRRLEAWAKGQRNCVSCYQIALGDRSGEATIHIHEEHTPSSSLLLTTDRCKDIYPQTQAQNQTQIRISTLDDTLQDELVSMSCEILLKMDVQGYEDRVLRGGSRVLSKCRAVILEVSIDSLYVDQADFHKLSSLLYTSGFRYAGNLDQVYAADGHVIYLDAVFLRQ